MAILNNFRRVSLATVALAIGSVHAQSSDVIWHNRYHALLAMGVYGDWNTLCPQQTFTQAGLLKNFPDSTADPWTVLDTWGPTEHGSEGFTAYIPEMDKVTLVFKGDYNTEKNWPIQSTDITGPLNLGEACQGCSANAYALAGYLEAVEATNGFEKAVAKWKEVGCYFSVTGHGIGGAHSLLATLHYHDMIQFSHNFGTPRVLNPAAAAYYDYLLGGTQIDRGSANADSFVSLVPQSDDWAFTNTAIWYHGYNETYKMNMEICFEAPEDTSCMPQGDLNELDHYFYMSNVGQCGGDVRQDTSVAQAYIDQQSGQSTPLPAVAANDLSTGASTGAISSSVTESVNVLTTNVDSTNATMPTSTSATADVSPTVSGTDISTSVTQTGGGGGASSAATVFTTVQASQNAKALAAANGGGGDDNTTVTSTGSSSGVMNYRGSSSSSWIMIVPIMISSAIWVWYF